MGRFDGANDREALEGLEEDANERLFVAGTAATNPDPPVEGHQTGKASLPDVTEITDSKETHLHGSLADSAIKSPFFIWMATVMLVLNLVGFAPSYFLKHWFESPELALRTHVHGVIFTGWFLILLVQTMLIRAKNTHYHRRIGAASLTVAIAMVMSGLLLLYHRSMLYHSGERGLEGTAFVVWGNLALLLGFVSFVTLGFLFRRRSSYHKRLMLLASIAMMPQALARIGYIPQLAILEGMGNNVLYAFGGLLILMIAMLVHDRISEGKLHPATRFGVPTLILLIVSGTFLLPQTKLGVGLILSLG